MKQTFFNLKNKNLHIKNNFVINYINKYVRRLNKDIKNINFLGLPTNEVNFFLEKTLFELFDLKSCSFNKKLSILLLPYYIFVFIFYIFYIFFFKKNNYITKKYLLLFDNISSLKELELYNEFVKKNKKNISVFRTTNNLFSKNRNLIYHKRYKGYSLGFQDLITIFKLFKISISVSLKYQVNFLFLALKVVDNILYYKTLFKKIKAKHLIMHQYYISNNIKNYYFKLNGGYKTSLIQKNILSMHNTGYFFDTDNFFSIGINTLPNKNKIMSRIKNNVVVGSFLMHANKKIIRNKLKKNNFKYDILYVAGNQFQPGGQFDTYNSHNADYKEQIKWLIRIKNEFPSLRVGFKHHSNNKNNYELDLLNNSGVEIIKKNKNSYLLCVESRMICSWASTMILEMKPLNYNSFFLDPNYKNIQFFNYLKNSKKIRINNYNKFKSCVLHSIKNKKFNNFDINYCLDYKNVVNKISSSLN